MTLKQAGDALFFSTPDGGEINVEDGVTEMTELLESSVFLCLAGGNREDNVTPSTEKLQWMGNEDEEDKDKFRSRTGALIHGRPLTSALIKEVGESAALDILDGLGNLIKSVASVARIINNKRLDVISNIELFSGEAVTITTSLVVQ